VRVLERDATWRRIVEQMSGDAGIAVRPNPHASLYMHVVDKLTGRPQEPEPLARDGDVIGLGIARVVRILPLFFQEGVDAEWLPAAREVVRASDAELRAYGARLAREVLALIVEVEKEAGAGG
jgi:hypothetical protein